MKKSILNFVQAFVFGSFALLAFSSISFAAPITRTAAGANPAAIQAAVDQFRADLGNPLNPNTAQTFLTGRREINWDGVPDNLASPNALPPNFFNSNSPRGAVFFNPGNNGAAADLFRVSANNTTATAVRFGEVDPSYTNIFQTFSAQRLFAPLGTNITEIDFFIPGSRIAANVSGFGVIFTDVDNSANTFVKLYAADGTKLATVSAPAANNGLSFVGVSFNAGERVAKVIIQSGNVPLAAGNVDNNGTIDVVAMDDFIYGEPRATGHHSNDYDGDGAGDLAIFRPSNGIWAIFNGGSNTVVTTQFGANGDVPVDGDFDGDGRTDIAVFRPSAGQWFYLRSSTGGFVGVPFGQLGDKPVAADYDKDGITDIAVWRPSTGTYFVLRSSNGSFFSAQWGANGDIPIGSAIVP